MSLNFIIGSLLIGIAVFVGWAELMFYLAGKEQSIMFGGLYSLTLSPLLFISSDMVINPTTRTDIIAGILILGFLIFVGMTLYKQAGNSERRWYYLTLLMPVLAFVYRFVER